MSKILVALCAALGLVMATVPAGPATAVDDEFFSYVQFTPKTIYPLVRDGYREYVHLYWESDEYDTADDASYGADYVVSDAQGEVVFTGSVGTDRTYLQWRGVDAAGETVPVGTYTVTLTAYDRWGDGHTLTREVTVATKRVTKRDQVYRSGASGNVWFWGNCDNRYPAGTDHMVIDCWGGDYMQANYTLNVPKRHRKTATITDFYKSGRKECCRRGTFRTRIWKEDRDTVRATFKVTGWRAYRIRYVVMDYKYTVRI